MQSAQIPSRYGTRLGVLLMLRNGRKLKKYSPNHSSPQSRRKASRVIFVVRAVTQNANNSGDDL